MIKKGFTLVELITVIIIIAILVALALPQYTRVIERGQASTARAALDSIRKAEGLYFALWSSYSTDRSRLATEVPEVNTYPTAEWTYNITVPVAAVNSFTATATRERGRYDNDIITIDHDGAVGGGHPAVDNAW